VMSGSSISAGKNAASLRLTRGGEVRLCSATTLTASASTSGSELMLGLNAGELELHYYLAVNADTLMTPDFRLLLAGPASIHIGVNVDPSGTMCVQSLAGNSGSVIVSEVAGDGTYQVRPGQHVIFRNGRVADAWNELHGADCGCPPAEPIIRAAAPGPLKPAEEEKAPATMAAVPQPVPLPDASTPDASAGNVQIQVDAPMIYRGSEAEPAPPVTFATLRLAREGDSLLYFDRVALPPEPPKIKPPAPEQVTATAQPSRHRGVFRRLGTLIAAMFR
jgi:hypothetical protein